MDENKIYIKLEDEFNLENKQKGVYNEIKIGLAIAYFVSSAIVILVLAFIKTLEIEYKIIDILSLIVLTMLFINAFSFVKIAKNKKK